jgi:hypothetical protein
MFNMITVFFGMKYLLPVVLNDTVILAELVHRPPSKNFLDDCPNVGKIWLVVEGWGAIRPNNARPDLKEAAACSCSALD